MPMVPSPNAPMVFTFPATAQPVRSLMIDGEPWFVGKDACDAVGISKYRDALPQLDEDERVSAAVDTLGGAQVMTLVSEPGVYALMLISRSRKVKEFRRWLTHEVIPQIRKTGRFEAQPEPPKEITAAAGPLPYRDQAELLVILRPVLPEPYAAATGKVIMARVMGERPELDPSETPLYASTFLAEKGHRPATVAKFQSGFGSRVSNAYLKLHGRRPEKIPGPAGSRIDKVAVYSEEDRPLLDQVYAGLADIIDMFETGGQTAIGA